MKTNLSIREYNVKAHLDIERDMQTKHKNGLFTFNIRINQGNITDYADFETVTAKDYAGLISLASKEPDTSRNS